LEGVPQKEFLKWKKFIKEKNLLQKLFTRIFPSFFVFNWPSQSQFSPPTSPIYIQKKKKSILIIPSHDPFDQTAIFAELETQTRCSNITRTYCVNKSNRVFVCEQERTVK